MLASASTIRAQLLAAAGVYFRIEPAELDECLLKQACRAEGRDAPIARLLLPRSRRARLRHALVEPSSLAPINFWSAARFGSTSPRISDRPAPNFGPCAGEPTSLSQQFAPFRMDCDYGMP